MLECRACLLRCIRAIAGPDTKGNHLAPRQQLLLTPRLSPPSFRRHASTAIAQKANTKIKDDELVPGKQPIVGDGGVGDERVKRAGSIVIRDERALKMELRYLEDPVKLAEHVHYTLRNNKPDKALDLCRLASKKQEVIVSWNHVIDWHMSRNQIETAMKVYNEMKKRAQFPDSYTYMMLLRGLSQPHHHDGEPLRASNVVKAVSIYNSMTSPTSRVQPSILHTNAVLKVCSAAIDMDALWGIVAKLPSSGAGGPDHITYAILLNAIRHGAFGRNPDPSLEMIAARRNKAVQEGRAIWRDVIAKWRAGEVLMDEELVCAVGRLLLMSSHMQDWDDVLSLIQQTMKLERLVPALGSPERNTEHVPQDNDLRQAEAVPEEDSEGYTDTPATKAFLPVQPFPRDSSNPHRPTSLVWVKPGNPTLSLLIGACTLLRIPKTANTYWDILTGSQYGVKPDIANFHTQLRLLSKNRASARAVSLITEGMKAANVTPKYQTFRIAMSVCVRDKNNHTVLSHARSIIDLMEATSADLDIHTLMQYLNLSLSTDSGPKIVATLDRLDPIVHNLRSRITYGADEATHRVSPQDHLVDKEQTVQFLQAIVGVINTLMTRGLVPREDFGYWTGRRGQLTQFIARSRGNMDKTRARMEHERNAKEPPVESKKAPVGRREYNRASGGSRNDGTTTEGFRMGTALKNFRRREMVQSRRGKEVQEQAAREGGWGVLGKRQTDFRTVKGVGDRPRTKMREVGIEGGFADSPAELAMR